MGAYFMKQPAVQQVWRHMVKVYNTKGTDLVDKVDTIKDGLVPGLNGVSFGTVFAALQKGGCPMWMIGGTVRDLLSGRTPNDVDCATVRFKSHPADC